MERFRLPVDRSLYNVFPVTAIAIVPPDRFKILRQKNYRRAASAFSPRARWTQRSSRC
jgi:hypothetical protein